MKEAKTMNKRKGSVEVIVIIVMVVFLIIAGVVAYYYTNGFPYLDDQTQNTEETLVEEDEEPEAVSDSTESEVIESELEATTTGDLEEDFMEFEEDLNSL